MNSFGTQSPPVCPLSWREEFSKALSHNLLGSAQPRLWGRQRGAIKAFDSRGSRCSRWLMTCPGPRGYFTRLGYTPLSGFFFFFNSHLFYLFIYFYIYFWLCWVFVSVPGLPLVAASGGHSSSRCTGLFTIAASLVAEHRLQTRRLSSCGSRA